MKIGKIIMTGLFAFALGAQAQAAEPHTAQLNEQVTVKILLLQSAGVTPTLEEEQQIRLDIIRGFVASGAIGIDQAAANYELTSAEKRHILITTLSNGGGLHPPKQD